MAPKKTPKMGTKKRTFDTIETSQPGSAPILPSSANEAIPEPIQDQHRDKRQRPVDNQLPVAENSQAPDEDAADLDEMKVQLEEYPLDGNGAGSMDIDKDAESKTKRKPTRKSRQGVPKPHAKPLHTELPPIVELEEIFGDITQKALRLGFRDVVAKFAGRQLKIATMCSGTEAPLLAMQMVSDALATHNLQFLMEHLFSAEIVPYKQAYIDRNFDGGTIFRDIREFAYDGLAWTAYGDPADIPTDVDMLIAGFACVDYSPLNVNPQPDLEHVGESTDTHGAILIYAKRVRPPLVLLENVNQAPWEDIEQQWRAIGYGVMRCRLDTKMYYLPHTRNRVYLLAIEGRKMMTRANAESVAQRWQQLMKDFERPASSSVECFLLRELDPRLNDAVAEMAEKKSKGLPDWGESRKRHVAMREELQLSNQHVYTHWRGRRTGHVNWGYRHWMQRQVPRIWDSIEILYGQGARRGYDIGYKPRFPDVSQNVDRNHDRAPQGITGCVTPAGLPYATYRGGPLVGLEALALQGIPTDRLSLTTESQRQLFDLAGNAMTTTVVGSAMLSALIACHPFLSLTDHTFTVTLPPQPPVCFVDEKMLAPGQVVNFRVPGKTWSLADMAAQSVRWCRCEDDNDTRNKLKCRVCAHTACIRCAGIPAHVYSSLDRTITLNPSSPSRFLHALHKALPTRLALPPLTLPILQALCRRARHRPCLADEWSHALAKATDSVVYHYHSEIRSDMWKINYEAQWSRLELRLGKQQPQWLLFVKPELHLAANDQLRQILSRPVARMTNDSEHGLLAGTWQICIPAPVEFHLIIQGVINPGSPSTALTPSWLCRIGCLDRQDERVWQRIQVEVADEGIVRHLDTDIRGEYELRPDCGTANGALHQRVSGSYPDGLFLFLDPDRTSREPHMDEFVFANDPRRLSLGEHRYVFATLGHILNEPRVESDTAGPTKWRPSSVAGPQMVSCSTHGEWVSWDNARLEVAEKPGADFAVAQHPLIIPLGRADCTEARTLLLSGRLPLPNDGQPCWRNSSWTAIDPSGRSDLLATLAWLTPRIRRQGWEGFDRDWSELPLREADFRCEACVPSRSTLTWGVESAESHDEDSVDDDLADKDSNDAGMEHAVVDEDSTNDDLADKDPIDERAEQAVDARWKGHESSYYTGGSYEMARKKRPAPFEIVTKCDGVYGRFGITLNLPTLVHCLLGKLIDSAPDQKIGARWRLESQYELPIPQPLPQLTIPDNRQDRESPYMLKSVPGSQSTYALRPEQRRSLSWMLRQESTAAESFAEEEIAEASLPELGLRVEVVAHRSRAVHGGLLADDVGYGKTILILALIDAQASTAAAAGGLTDPDPRNGYISLKATLIIVPTKPLMVQWQAEIIKFLGMRYKLLVINDLTVSGGPSVAQMKEADIILLPFSIVCRPPYQMRMARFAGMSAATKTGNPKVWPAEFKRRCRTHVEMLKQTPFPSEFGQYLNEELGKFQPADEPIRRPKPSFRLRGRKYREANTKTTPRGHEGELAGDVQPEVQPKVQLKIPTDDCFKFDQLRNLDQLKGAPLQAFHFDRIVVDECSYATDRSYEVLISMEATFRWLLSATPGLVDYWSVNRLARMIGASLGVDDFAKKPAKKAVGIHTTLGEFLSARESHSYVGQLYRHERAQHFLNRFARQNQAEIEAITQIQHWKPVLLPAAEYVDYLWQQLRHNKLAPNTKKTFESRENLYKSCSCRVPFERADESTEDTRELERLEQSIREKLAKASATFRRKFPSMGTFDPDATPMLRDLAAAFTGTGDDRSKPSKDLNADANTFAGIIRRCRLRNRLADFQTWDEPRLFRADCDHLVFWRPGAATAEDVYVHGQCGHTLCALCKGPDADPDCCGVKGCTEPAPNSQVIRASKVAGRSGVSSDTEFGQKVHDIVGLIKNIAARNEQALLFVQFREFRDQIATALQREGILFRAVDDKETRMDDNVAAMTDFRTKFEITVLLLGAGSSSAAGHNLTNANHVVFASPLLADTRERCNAQYTQAVGRACRFGQRKAVSIYEFLALDTLEVNAAQDRSGKRAVYREPGDLFSLVSNDELTAAEHSQDFAAPVLEDTVEVYGEAEGLA